MAKSIEVLFTPAEFSLLPQRDLSATVCVVFDVLRATSTMITALAHGALGVIPVGEIPEALALQKGRPELLLAGERQGLRIDADLTGGRPFDLGNSPREFLGDNIRDRTIVSTTTNGTRALRACQAARIVFVGSLLNLSATAQRIPSDSDVLIVCSGTFEQIAYEDVLGAGALCDLLLKAAKPGILSDSARIALDVYRSAGDNLFVAISASRNGRRLLEQADLREDVRFCAQRDLYPIVAALGPDGVVRVAGEIRG